MYQGMPSKSNIYGIPKMAKCGKSSLNNLFQMPRCKQVPPEMVVTPSCDSSPNPILINQLTYNHILNQKSHLYKSQIHDISMGITVYLPFLWVETQFSLVLQQTMLCRTISTRKSWLILHFPMVCGPQDSVQSV